MPNPVVNNDARSPYQRYGKRPFQYSSAFQEWERAIRSGDGAKIRECALAHSRQFFGALTPSEQAFGNRRGGRVHA